MTLPALDLNISSRVSQVGQNGQWKHRHGQVERIRNGLGHVKSHSQLRSITRVR